MLPVQKHSKSRKRKRRTHHALKPIHYVRCPQCGNAGFAEASETDDPKRKHPGFSVDHLPRGFFIQRASNHQETSMIKCECGRKFPFRSLDEAAAQRD